LKVEEITKNNILRLESETNIIRALTTRWLCWKRRILHRLQVR